GLRGSTAASAVSYRHTDQPVWRGSFDVCDLRAQVGRLFGDGSTQQGHAVITAIVETAIAWADKVKEEGKAHQLTTNVIKTLERTLRSFMDFRTGACEASYDLISKAAYFGRITVIRHMKILRDLKWFDWVRRTEPTGNGPKEGPRVKQAANAYFFEISRLPVAAQIHLRQILKRRGIRLDEHPERQGSGPVPNRIQRLASRVSQALSGARGSRRSPAEKAALIDEAAFVRAEMAFFGDIPTDRWAALRHPQDPAAQAAYNARLGIDLCATASTGSSPESPLQNGKDKEFGSR
ncbi:MAG TPA: hypothetical protein VFF98_14780, partial [Novosphingobium sp.]|nr:hypothetical protein [Novosphingobium sp.]